MTEIKSYEFACDLAKARKGRVVVIKRYSAAETKARRAVMEAAKEAVANKGKGDHFGLGALDVIAIFQAVHELERVEKEEAGK
jgi:hypothetical protein